jgi:hypothetical protein
MVTRSVSEGCRRLEIIPRSRFGLPSPGLYDDQAATEYYLLTLFAARNRVAPIPVERLDWPAAPETL